MDADSHAWRCRRQHGVDHIHIGLDEFFPVVAAPLNGGADFGITEFHQRGFIDLQIGASRLIQSRELAAIHLDHIAPELIERGIRFAQQRIAATQKCSTIGEGTVIFGVRVLIDFKNARCSAKIGPVHFTGL